MKLLKQTNNRRGDIGDFFLISLGIIAILAFIIAFIAFNASLPSEKDDSEFITSINQNKIQLVKVDHDKDQWLVEGKIVLRRHSARNIDAWLTKHNKYEK